MANESIFTEIARLGVVPVIAIEMVEAALPLADALLEGGLPLGEITFRTPAAAKVIATMTRRRPELLVGAGTVLSQENVRAALEAGARFGVAPGLNPAVVACAAEAGLPFAPGVSTAGEIEQALALDCRLVKFFPAELCGGVEMIKALHAPYSHTGIRFMPTGGINAAKLENYLSQRAVAAVGGTWIARPEDIAGACWQTIRDRCRQAVEIVRRVREAAP